MVLVWGKLIGVIAVAIALIVLAIFGIYTLLKPASLLYSDVISHPQTVEITYKYGAYTAGNNRLISTYSWKITKSADETRCPYCKRDNNGDYADIGSEVNLRNYVINSAYSDFEINETTDTIYINGVLYKSPTVTPTSTPTPQGTLIIWSNPSGASVSINDVVKGTTNGSDWLTLTMNTSTYTVKIAKPGYKTYIQQVTINNNEQAKVEAHLTSLTIGTPAPTATKTPDVKCAKGFIPSGNDCVWQEQPKATPGFEAGFAIIGFITIAFLVFRRGT